MDNALNKIILSGSSVQSSINPNLLRKHTKQIAGNFLREIQWPRVETLHILGSDQSADVPDTVEPGAYADPSGTWVALIGVGLADIHECIARCGASLRVLSARFTPLRDLDAAHLPGLERLILERNAMLSQLFGLHTLSRLTELSLSGTALGPVIHLTGLDALEVLRMDHTAIRRITADAPLPGLRVLWVSGTPLSDTGFLSLFPSLRDLDLSNTDVASVASLEGCKELETLFLLGAPITHLPPLGGLEKLSYLSLSYTKVASLEDVSLPDSLTDLYLNGIPLKHLPDHLGSLPALQTLDLSNLELDSLPLWLPDLNLNFSLGEETGIRLGGTHIKGVDMSIFSRPREMIVQWFDLQKKKQAQPNGRNHTLFLGYSHIGKSTFINSILERIKDYGTISRPQFVIVDQDVPRKPSLFNHYLRTALWDTVNPPIFPNRYTLPVSVPPLSEWVAIPEPARDVAIGGCVSDIAEISLPPEVRPEEDGQAFTGFLRSPERWKIGWDDVLSDPNTEQPPEDLPEPLNEIKVVFLGDGEAGKSHTIARLLNDGGEPLDFTGTSTPGIVIHNKAYEIGGREIQVHFWDFGGQEILHSMHRMFLTKQTLYVVLVNVREGNQDERARYWLQNIRSFAESAPVLLVLNKMDMNRNASVNENDLRAMYPQLTEVVRMSAMNDSAASIRSNLIAAMKRQIGAMDILKSSFLPAWSKLKEKLQNMTTPYIRGAQYARISEECGVDKSDTIRKELLKWFSELGVSFCYGGSPRLEDYVVLRPTWITNAIYIIIFNKIDEVKNGLVSHDAIFRLLNPTSAGADRVQRAAQDEVYKVEEVEYVLNVIRKFWLSFQVDPNTEFMPMLCQGNSTPAADDYANDPDTFEFRMEYDYLPNNVIHRLMVERHRELDRENVWLTGARFVHGRTGLSAVVKSEGNLLRIIVRATKPRYTADMYLDLLKDDLTRINAEMNLRVVETNVVYKYNGTTELFDYEDLLLALEFGDLTIRSKKQRKKIPIQEILHQTDHHVDESRRQLLLDLAGACQKLQDNKNNWDLDEDGRTMYIRDILSEKYSVKDQPLGGVSEKGLKPGRLDLDIRRESNVPWTILEALIVKGQGKAQLKNWDLHLKKLLDNYNAIGRPFLLHVSYVDCPKDKFYPLYTTFWEHLRSHSPVGFSLHTDATRELNLAADGQAPNLFIKAAECVYDCGGLPMTVYHFFVLFGE